MFAIIAVLLPSILGLMFFEYLYKKMNMKQSVYIYVLLLLISCLFNNFICCFAFEVKDSVIVFLENFPMFFFKYVFISITINIILAFVFTSLIKNCSIKVVVSDEENVKKKKAKKS